MSRRAWILFVAVSLLWGSSFLLIKIAVDEVSPSVLVLLRALLGALVLLPIAAARGSFAPLRGSPGALLALAVVDVAAPFLLIAWGEQRISSSLAGILLAADPIFVALLALRFDRSERVRGARLAGLVVGIVGVVVLLGLDVGGEPAELAGAGMVLGASFCFAVAALLYKGSFGAADPIGVVCAMLAVSALLVAPPAVATFPTQLPSATALMALGALGVFNTGLGFWLFYALIDEVGAGKASLITYLIPGVAAVLGIAVLSEDFGPNTALGLALILGGSWVASGGLEGRRGVRLRRRPDAPRQAAANR